MGAESRLCIDTERLPLPGEDAAWRTERGGGVLGLVDFTVFNCTGFAFGGTTPGEAFRKGRGACSSLLPSMDNDLGLGFGAGFSLTSGDGWSLRVLSSPSSFASIGILTLTIRRGLGAFIGVVASAEVFIGAEGKSFSNILTREVVGGIGALSVWLSTGPRTGFEANGDPRLAILLAVC